MCDPNYEMMQDNEWTYDDAERTAVTGQQGWRNRENMV